jgi:hypothetical protein
LPYLRVANIPVVGGIREGLAAIDRLARYAVLQGQLLAAFTRADEDAETSVVLLQAEASPHYLSRILVRLNTKKSNIREY